MKGTAAALLLALGAAGTALAGGGPENVLVVVNDLCPDSVEIGRYYVLKRDVPRHHVVHVKIPGTPPAKDAKPPFVYRVPDVIPGGYDGYVKLLEEPVRQWLAEHPKERITTILLTRGIPVCANPKGAERERRSTAHLLACHAAPDEGWKGGSGDRKNPIHRTDVSVDPAHPSKEGAPPIFCVGMINAFDLADMKRMVDLAVEADAKPRKGTVYLGESAEKDPRGMYSPSFPKLGEILKALGFKSEIVPHATNRILLENRQDVMFYQYGQAGWDPTFPAKNRFLPGCVVDNLTSFGLVPAQFDASTTQGQTPMPHFLRAGATAVQGCVAEPTTGAWDPEYYHIQKYFEGYNLIESYTMGHPWMPWMNLVCGDPLLQPWALRPTLKEESFEPVGGEKGKKGDHRLKVSAKAARDGAKVALLRLYVDGIAIQEAEGESAEFELPGFDPDVNRWTVVAVDDSKFRTQGSLRSAGPKRDSGKLKAFLDRTTKTSMTVKLNYDGREPVVTWHAPGARQPVGTKRGRQFTFEWEKEGAHAVELWVDSAKTDPQAFYFEAPARK